MVAAGMVAAGTVAGTADGTVAGTAVGIAALDGAGAAPFVIAGGVMAVGGVAGSAPFRTLARSRVFPTQHLAPPLAGLFVANASI